jgi:hypothetical protein
MLMMKERRPAIRTLQGWAISVLLDAGAIRECEEHGWMKDCGDPDARERAPRRRPPGSTVRRLSGRGSFCGGGIYSAQSATCARSARQISDAGRRCWPSGAAQARLAVRTPGGLAPRLLP